MKTVLMDKMNNALQYLNTCLAEREELLRFMAVAVLTRRNLFILGLPGQAKSDARCFPGSPLPDTAVRRKGRTDVHQNSRQMGCFPGHDIASRGKSGFIKAVPAALSIPEKSPTPHTMLPDRTDNGAGCSSLRPGSMERTALFDLPAVYEQKRFLSVCWGAYPRKRFDTGNRRV